MDIAEEVGRIYGFENIPAVLMNGDTFQGSLAREFQAEDKVKDVLVALLDTQGMMLVQEKGENGRLMHIQAMNKGEVAW